MSFIISQVRRSALLAALLTLLLCLLATGAAAAELETLCTDDYCFSAEDFDETAQLTGIFVTETPSAAVGDLRYGDRVIRAGDALPASALSQLVLSPTCTDDREATVCYLPITDAGVGVMQTLKIGISSGKNEVPTAKDGSLETYKNIANTGMLDVADPEGAQLRYDLISAPRRGTVELHEDGTFTYTPAKNKVGKDSFTFTATDEAGNVSNEAEIRIEILKPADKLTYGDMAGDADHFTALWLRNEELFSGESIAGVTCFCPDKPVTRGEFLVMVSRLTDLAPDEAELTSGFADESVTPQWMRPYIVSALRAGVISGVNSEDGLVFLPDEALTNAEAAVMLQNILRLPEARETAAFPEDAAVPAWAADAVCALSDAGLPVDYESCGDAVTRRDAAKLLYAAHQVREAGEDNTLF